MIITNTTFQPATCTGCSAEFQARVTRVTPRVERETLCSVCDLIARAQVLAEQSRELFDRAKRMAEERKQSRERMRVLVVEPGREPEVREIGPSLEAWQAIVGGPVEAAPLGRNLTLFVHRDGIDLALAYNRRIGEHDVVGPAFIASSNPRTGQTCGLDDESLAKALARLQKPRLRPSK